MRKDEQAAAGFGRLLDSLFRKESEYNYSIYTLLSQYYTEFLLFIMAKANNEKIKKIISIISQG
jgi:hypothetical protein